MVELLQVARVIHPLVQNANDFQRIRVMASQKDEGLHRAGDA
jgi:hypothetical protein